MIYNENFVWLHFPKCAGNTIENLFRMYFGNDSTIFQDAIDQNSGTIPKWHDSIAKREAEDKTFSLGDRIVVCSFRQLPSWLISRYNYEVERNPGLPHRAESLIEGRFYEQSGFENHADYYARWYLPENILEHNDVRWIRTEFFEMDFKAAFADLIDLSRIPSDAYRMRSNVSISRVPQRVRDVLFAGDRSVYAKCPYWSSLEDFAYRQGLPNNSEQDAQDDNRLS